MNFQRAFKKPSAIELEKKYCVIVKLGFELRLHVCALVSISTRLEKNPNNS